MNLKPNLLIFFLSVASFLYGQATIDSLLQEASSADGEEKASILYEISGELMHEDPDSALSYLARAEDLIGNERGGAILPAILLRKCFLYRSLNNPELSLNNGRLAHELYKARNEPAKVGLTGLTVGNIYFNLGYYSRALEYYIESMEAYEQMGNISRVAHLHNNLGTISHETGDLETAESHYRESLQLYSQAGETIKTKKVLNNLGMLFYDKQAYDSALVYLFVALDLADNASDEDHLIISGACNNIALVYFEKDQIETGLDYLQRSLRTSRLINNLYNELSAYTNLGSFHTALGNYDSSLYYINRGLQKVDSVGYRAVKLELMKEKSRLYAAMNQYEEAYLWGCKADTLDDLLFNEDMSERMANLRVAYEQEIQESEIQRLSNARESQITLAYIFLAAIIITIILIIIIAVNLRAKRRANLELRDKNAQLTDAIRLQEASQEELQKLNRSKDRLFSIVAHDLRNPVSAIAGFTELLQENFDQLDVKTQKEYLMQIMHGTQRMQNLLENLLIWARSQMNAIIYEPVEIQVSELVKAGLRQVDANIASKKVGIQTDVQDELTIFADYSMLITVLRNILMNAVKFSFPGGNIKIRAYADAGKGHITVIDEGIGIQPEIQEKLFNENAYYSTPGTSGEAGSGLGLVISKDFMEKNNGTLSVKSVPGKGSEFTMSLPLAP